MSKKIVYLGKSNSYVTQGLKYVVLSEDPHCYKIRNDNSSCVYIRKNSSNWKVVTEVHSPLKIKRTGIDTTCITQGSVYEVQKDWTATYIILDDKNREYQVQKDNPYWEVVPVVKLLQWVGPTMGKFTHNRIYTIDEESSKFYYIKDDANKVCITKPINCVNWLLIDESNILKVKAQEAEERIECIAPIQGLTLEKAKELYETNKPTEEEKMKIYEVQHRVQGKLVEDCSEQDFIDAIIEQKAAINHLEQTEFDTHSSRLKVLIREARGDLTDLVKLLDGES